MFPNIAALSSVPVEWRKHGYRHGPWDAHSRATYTTSLLSTAVFDAPIVQLRFTPPPTPGDKHQAHLYTGPEPAGAPWAELRADENGEHSPACPLTCTECWTRDDARVAQLLSFACMSPFYTGYTENGTLAWIAHEMCALGCEQGTLVYVHRVDVRKCAREFVEGVDAAQGLQWLADATTATTGTHGDGGAEDANMTEASSNIEVESACASVVVVCLDERHVGARLMDLDAPVSIDVVRKDTRASVRRHGELCKSVSQLSVQIPDCRLEPAIPVLDRRHGLALQLYDYQRRTLHWMLRMDCKDARVIEYDNGKGLNYLRNLRMDIPSPVKDPIRFREKSPYRNSAQFSLGGAMLCAPTGTGKTTCAIVLWYLCRVFWVHQQAATPASSAAIAQSPSSSSSSSSSDQAQRVPRKAGQSGYVLPNGLYYSRCMLIVAPRQVLSQWRDEFAKTLVCMPRVVVIRDARDARKFGTVHALDDSCDVLIVCKDLFTSPAYRRLDLFPGTTSCPDPSAQPFLQDYSNSDPVRRVVANNNADQCAAPGAHFLGLVVHAIHFDMALLDEMHEYMRATVRERALDLSATRKWGLTATPNFTDPASFTGTTMAKRKNSPNFGYERLMRFTPVHTGVPPAPLFVYSTETARVFVRQAALTSTPEHLPPLIAHRVAVALSVRERAMYASMAGRPPREQLLYCSHHDAVGAVATQAAALSVTDASDRMCATYRERRAASAAAADTARRAFDLVCARVNAMVDAACDVDEVFVDVLTTRRTIDSDDDDDADVECTPDDVRRLARAIVWCAELRSADAPRVTVNRIVYNLWRSRALTLANDNDADKEPPAKRAKTTETPPDATETPPAADATDARVDDVDDDTAATTAAVRAARPVHEAIAARLLPLADCRDGDARLLEVHAHLGDTLNEYDAVCRARDRAEREADAAARQCAYFEEVFNQLANARAHISCPICLADDEDQDCDLRTRVAVTQCGHNMCTACAKDWRTRAGAHKCVVCRRALDPVRDVHEIERVAPPPPPLSAVDGANDGLTEKERERALAVERHGSKLVALAELVRRVLTDHPGEKVIVFAQFERLLHLVGDALATLDIGTPSFIYVNGTARACQRSLDRFRSDPDMRVMLLSGERNNSGVTLTVASHVIAVHPPHDDANDAERACGMLRQAVGRIRRPGQTRACHLWSLVTDDTIEARMYADQRARIEAHDQGVTFVDNDDAAAAAAAAINSNQ